MSNEVALSRKDQKMLMFQGWFNTTREQYDSLLENYLRVSRSNLEYERRIAVLEEIHAPKSNI